MSKGIPGSAQVLFQDDALPEQAALDRHLRLAIDNLRGTMAPVDGLHLIMALILYKRLSDTWEEEQQLQAYMVHEEDRSRACYSDGHQFEIPRGCLWSDVRRLVDGRGKALSEALRSSFRSIEYHNPRLQQIFQDVGFSDSHRCPPLQLEGLFCHIDHLRLRRAEFSSHALGDACERLRERFEGEVIKRGGGFFTPTTVARLMVALAAPQGHATIYDPVCGSAGLLVESVRYLARSGGDTRSLHLFGHECGVSITRISLLLYEIDNATLDRSNCPSGTSLADPVARWADDGLPRPKFDYILSNPPFSASFWRYEQYKHHDFFGHYVFGRPPQGCGDFAFLQYMLASLADGGRMAVIMPIGALFRRSAARIRQEMVESDLLEAVVALGPKLFVSTNVSVVLLIFRRGKSPERRGRVLFVDGDTRYAPGEKRRQLRDEHSRRILDAFHSFGDDEGFSCVVTLDEIQRQKADLSVSLYVSINREAAGNHVEPRPNRRTRRVTTAFVPVSAANEQIGTARAKLDQLREWKNQRVIKLLSGPGGVGRQFTAVGDLPRDWQLVPLKEVLRDKLLNGYKNKKDEIGTGVRFIGQKSFTADGSVDFHLHRRVQLSGNKCGHFAICPEDLLVIRVNGSRELCGRAALAPEPPEPTVCESSMIRLRTDPARIDPLLLMYWLNHAPVRGFLEPQLYGSLQISINHRQLSSIPCPLLPDRERHDICSELRDLHAAVLTAAADLARIEMDSLAPAQGGALDGITQER